MNVTLFGNSLCRCSHIKQRSYWVRVDLKSNNWCPYRKAQEAQTHTEERCLVRWRQKLEWCRWESGNPRACRQTPGKRQGLLLLQRLHRPHDAADALISDFTPPECEEIFFLLNHLIYGNFYSTPRKLLGWGGDTWTVYTRCSIFVCT